MARLLIIDDDLDMCKLLCTKLARKGYNVFSAIGGKEGMEVFAKVVPDMVLVDLLMPDMSGIEVMKRIRKQSNLVEIFIITANEDMDTAVQAMRLGAFNYLVKPINFSELEISLQRAMDKRKLSQKLDRYVKFLEGTIKEKDQEICRRREVEKELKDVRDQLYESNRNLEVLVEKELHKSRAKDQIITQQTRLASMGEMIGNIAHQWRQPLSSLGVLIQDLKDAYDFEELDEKYLNRSIGQAKGLIGHMSRTIDDFRNFFKSDKIKSEFNAQESIYKALNIIKASLSNNFIAVRFDVEGETNIIGLANEFEQVLINILSNARDALVDNKVENALITISAGKEESDYQIKIADNGGGVLEEILERVFEPYFTTKEQGKGTGVGLYMSKIIIEKNMGGSLTVQNFGDGAEFTIRVPINVEKD